MGDFALSTRSTDRLKGVDPRALKLNERAIQISPVDFGIAWMGGVRTDGEQNGLFRAGNSTKDGYHDKSKHQPDPVDGLGKAFDVIPFVNGKVVENQWNYAMIVTSFIIAAKQLGYSIRSGTNWDRDNEFLTDQKFQDYGHIEFMD